jgi:hypothetical protein
MGKPREFGGKVLIEEVDGGIISRYEILEEVGREHPHLPASLEAHQEHFRRVPQLLAADREASTRLRTRDWPTKRG